MVRRRAPAEPVRFTPVPPAAPVPPSPPASAGPPRRTLVKPLPAPPVPFPVPESRYRRPRDAYPHQRYPLVRPILDTVRARELRGVCGDCGTRIRARVRPGDAIRCPTCGKRGRA